MKESPARRLARILIALESLTEQEHLHATHEQWEPAQLLLPRIEGLIVEAVSLAKELGDEKLISADLISKVERVSALHRQTISIVDKQLRSTTEQIGILHQAKRQLMGLKPAYLSANSTRFQPPSAQLAVHC